MSDLKFSCPGCSQHIACDGGYAGMQINCPACRATMVVPGGAPVSQAGVSPPVCPGCGAAVSSDTVICTQCGLNLRTGKRIQAHTAAPGPTRPVQPQASSWARKGTVWVGVAAVLFVGLFLAGLANETAGMVYHGVTGLFGLGVAIMILVAAFQESVGQGFLTLCVPCYVIYFVFARSENPLLKALFLISILTRLAGLLVKLPAGMNLE